ncbi:flavodoxin family protein, partial [Candidatus Bathyarchaeota archaeon]|nr:flavodoxin family protein [Candidatus Bathyarchaeota archaeon]
MNCIVIVCSQHHQNTEKIAKVFAEVLDAQIQMPQQIHLEELHAYDLIGFGSWIDSEKHYQVLLDFANTLPPVINKKAFIFSTSAMPEITKKHAVLREILQSKGYTIIGEFNCRGFNTNGFLRVFGGMNKGRPNAEDLKHAEEFA